MNDNKFTNLDFKKIGRSPLESSSTTADPNASGYYRNDPEAVDPKLKPGRQVVYVEHSYNVYSDLDSDEEHSAEYSSELMGGVGSCSTQNLKNWNFEGFVFFYNNITDMVFGDPGPYILKKPKVIYNKNTTLFVMWSRMELLNTTSFQKRMSAVAVSPYSDGPFFLLRTFFPDGNRTADQIVFITDQNIPVLARTYYQTIEYLSPKQIMQPIWESVKYRNGSVNYRNNYHRTEYNVNYDNAHDIFNQIWRKENIPWEIHCINKITNITRILNFTNTYPRDGPICVTPDERKVVVGSGQVPIQSRFVDPSNPGNSEIIDIDNN